MWHGPCGVNDLPNSLRKMKSRVKVDQNLSPLVLDYAVVLAVSVAVQPDFPALFPARTAKS